MTQWRRVTVGEVAEVAIGPFGSSLKADLYVRDGMPVVSGMHLGRSISPSLDGADCVDQATVQRLERSVLRPGDLVFPHRGSIGRVGLVDRPMMMSTSMMRARFGPSVLPQFAYWYFVAEGNRQLLTMASSVGTPGIGQPLASLKSVPFLLPDLDVQQGIAEVLGALDDKIATNRRILNAADDLVRANYARLPASENVVLGDIARSVRQQVGAAEIGVNAVYVGLEHFDRERLWLQRFGAGGDVTSAKNAFETGDTLFGKLRPYFHKVGVAPESGVCSTDILVIRALDERTRWLVAAASGSSEAIARAVQNSNGTRMPRAKWEDIADLAVPDPASREVAAFEAWAEALGKRCFAAVVENETLAKTRDELLPLLMSGRITVKDAVKRVEGVA